jgi:protein-export membrane protein, SecD/SecF family
MQNKGAVKLLAILLALACVYQLSFTWFATKVENKAKEYAGNDLNKEQEYLNSKSDEVVYNFLGLYKYTYRDCNERKLNLGLDLKGGMNVILEVKVEDVIRALSNYSTDSTFNKALALATQSQVTNPKADFVTLFGESFEKIAPNAKLAAIFSTIELKEKVNFGSTNKQVLTVLREEANAAIDNSFNILQTRIDKFGVVQPIIQQLETKGRIEVQLPGVREPERVRKLLQGTANLEFWTTYRCAELWNDLVTANKRFADYKLGEKAFVDSTTQAKDTTAKAVASQETKETKPAQEKKEEVSLLKQIAKDTTNKGNNKLKTGNQDVQLLGWDAKSLLHPNYDPKTNQPGSSSLVGTARLSDTAKIGAYLRMPQIRTLFPRDVRFLWTSKPEKDKQNFVELHAIRISTRDGRAPLDGSAISDARGEYGQNKSVAEVNMQMNGDGAKVWAKLTRENKGRCIAIVLDNSVVSSPNVINEIPNGSSVITGNFTLNEANDLAIILKAGKMPAPARIIDENIVGPSLGKESINAGMLSFIIAFIGVLLYMWMYYGRAGSVANVALFTNVFFLFGVFASMGLVLTLPGIAGIVLTLAMAVDGNVIIYERMREEVRAGKGERMVVKDGFWHAYSAIIDGHVTTILTGIVLFIFGTGPVQGFATSLIVGLLLSLFSSIFIARLMFEWMLDKNIKITLGNKFTINAMTKANINFIGIRKPMYVISGIIITIGIISLFIRGLDPSVDFKGGRTFTVDLGKEVSTTDIRAALTKTFGEAPEVKTIGNENRVKITTKYLIDNKSAKTDSLVNLKLYEGLKSFIPSSITYQDFTSHSNTKKIGVQSSQKVDPVISSELIYKAFMAVFFGLIIIFIYIAIRFKNWKYGIGGVVSLTHDTLIVITMFSLFYGVLPFSLEVDQQFIAALLTIIGYSIMDTVIIYDRIREYKKLYPSRPLDENINSAINHTLGRTINTSGITVVVLVVIFIFGGEILRGFIFALLVGVITGTYSSVFNATPVAYDIIMLTEKKKKLK